MSDREFLEFRTSNADVDERLRHLAVMSEPSPRDYQSWEELQPWLVGIIKHIEALPPDMQASLRLASFQIGDAHVRWDSARINEWQREKAAELREHLSEFAVK
jgi:hypothetical protein